MIKLRLTFVLAISAGTVLAQTEPRYMEERLKEEILPPSVALFQLRQYILNRVGKLPAPSSAAEWTTDSKRIRDQIVNDVVFHGWPKEWVDAPPKFEDLGVTPGNGYQIRKLRYEIVPGFQSTAILYEPLNLHGKVPAILNVNGHVGAARKIGRVQTEALHNLRAQRHPGAEPGMAFVWRTGRRIQSALVWRASGSRGSE